MDRAEFVIAGGGIAGAAVAWALSEAGARDIIVLEAEPALFQHATGRNAAYFTPYYEKPEITRLALASEPFLARPAEDFSSLPILGRQGAVLAAGQYGALAADLEQSLARGVKATPISAADVGELVPIVRIDNIAAALYFPDDGRIDVDALAMGYVRTARRHGVRFECGRQLTGITTHAGKIAAVATSKGPIVCGGVINAAGAWAGHVGTMAGATPIGFTPMRRHMIVVKLPPQYANAGWPFFIRPDAHLYFKPEAGRLLACPIDEDPDRPGDCRTDDLRVAETADALNAQTTLTIRHIERSWAGHRTMTVDRLPVLGPDPLIEGFTWAAGLGGAGVMTSPAVGRIVAAAVLETSGAMHAGTHCTPDRFWLPPKPVEPSV